jgi:hypothetical protein
VEDSAQRRWSGAVRGAIRDIAAKPDARCSAGGAASRTHGRLSFKNNRRGSAIQIFSRGSVSAVMAIRSASTGTSTTRRFTNQRDGDFSNTGNAGDWRCSGCGRFWSEAEPAGLGGEMPHLGHDEGILARPGSEDTIREVFAQPLQPGDAMMPSSSCWHPMILILSRCGKPLRFRHTSCEDNLSRLKILFNI